MSDKRQATTSGAWMGPVQIESNSQSEHGRTPTHKGEISAWRVTVFFVLAVLVALALGYLAMVAWGINVALAVGVLVLLAVFVPLFGFDTLASTGYLHRRLETIVELDKIALATRQAGAINQEQQEAIELIWKELDLQRHQIQSLQTVRVHDKAGARDIPKRDEIDMSIDSWLAQEVFDANGMLAGVHPSGVLKGKYRFRGNDERSVQAHQRLVRAALISIRNPGNQYMWTGGQTLSDARRKLAEVA